MMSRPLVTVVTASLNSQEGLAATVASVAGQSFRSVEHVVIDGGSTDGTVDWLRQQHGIRWLSEKDGGISEALNKGVALASGEWLLVLQAEDTFASSTSLADAVSHLVTEAEIVSFDVRLQMGEFARTFKSRGMSFRMEFKTTIPHQGAFCRRSLFGRVGSFDPQLRIAMDFEWFLRCRRTGVAVDVVPAVLAVMPKTGVSSRLDWPSLRARFAEERTILSRHCRNRWMASLYAAYWPPYLTYRRLRAVVTRLPSSAPDHELLSNMRSPHL